MNEARGTHKTRSFPSKIWRISISVGGWPTLPLHPARSRISLRYGSKVSCVFVRSPLGLRMKWVFFELTLRRAEFACKSLPRATWSKRTGSDGTRETGRPRRHGIDSQGNAWTFLSRARRRCSGPSGDTGATRADTSISVKAVTTSIPTFSVSFLFQTRSGSFLTWSRSSSATATGTP